MSTAKPKTATRERIPETIGESPENPEQGRSLTKVLVQSEHVENLVKESAEDLSSVNAGIKQALVNQGSVPGLENALEKSEAVEGKVQDASDKLAVVNEALKDEVKGRHVLEGKLSAVTERGKLIARRPSTII